MLKSLTQTMGLVSKEAIRQQADCYTANALSNFLETLAFLSNGTVEDGKFSTPYFIDKEKKRAIQIVIPVRTDQDMIIKPTPILTIGPDWLAQNKETQAQIVEQLREPYVIETVDFEPRSRFNRSLGPSAVYIHYTVIYPKNYKNPLPFLYVSNSQLSLPSISGVIHPDAKQIQALSKRLLSIWMQPQSRA